MTMVTVAKMGKTIDYNGKKYGPSDEPLSVPLDLAVALGLQPLDGQTLVPPSMEAQAQEIAAAQNLAGQFQQNLELLLTQVRPLAKDDEAPDQTLNRLLAERDNLRASLDSLKQENQNNVRSMNSVGQQVTALQAKLDAAIHERDEARGVGQAAERLQLEAEGKLAAMTKERDEALRAFADDKRVAEYLEYVGELLPDGFPERKLLLENGYFTVYAVQHTTDEELKAVDGIADKRLEAIRKVAPFVAEPEGQ